jgi:hypothetical protein
MDTRFRCITPVQNIASLQASCATWPEPPPFPDPGAACCNLQDHSIAEQPTSTVGPHERALRDRRDARMDTVGTGRAVDSDDVVAGIETLEARPVQSPSLGNRRGSISATI